MSTQETESGLLVVATENFQAVVDQMGAYVNEFRLADGTNLLAPRLEYETISGEYKLRGTHICLPNFGPVHQRSGLTQHGFGRLLPWKVRETAGLQNSGVEMHLNFSQEFPPDEVPPQYYGLASTLRYTFGVDRAKNLATMGIMLDAKNNGDGEILFAPGFHPYFAVPEGVHKAEFTQIDEETGATFENAYLIKDMSGSITERVVSSGAPVTLQLGALVIKVTSSETLQMVTYWSDSADDAYICLEPTALGDNFDPVFRKKTSTLPLVLQKDERRIYETKIQWQLPKAA